MIDLDNVPPPIWKRFFGRLEVSWWRDTGKPPFRLYFWRYKPRTYSVCVYHWIFKAFLYKRTLWVSWCGPAWKGEDGQR